MTTSTQELRAPLLPFAIPHELYLRPGVFHHFLDLISTTVGLPPTFSHRHNHEIIATFQSIDLPHSKQRYSVWKK